MRSRPRTTLPIMDTPYEGIELLLELVAQYCPTQIQLDDLVRQHKEKYSLRLTYIPGKDDVLYFCQKQLGLFNIMDNQFHLSDIGQALYQYMHTPEFGIRLFFHLVECSRENFTFFYSAYEALEAYAQSGEFELPLLTFNSLLIEKSNKRSAKEIRSLLIGCSAVLEQGNMILISPDFFSVDLRQKQLERLWAHTAHILATEGRLMYPDLASKLKNLYPSVEWNLLETDFRSGLVLSRTRATEHVDGVRDSPPAV